MKIIQVTNIARFAAKTIPKQPQKNKEIVESIIKSVQKDGDVALKKYEKKFSGAKLSNLKVSKKEIENAYKKVSKQEIISIKVAKNRLHKTEASIKSNLKNKIINIDGVKISKKFESIQNVGCYIPGGLAKYPSSVIMS
ncbi:MAG: histidinol dehydrogenase, partial [Candidatus Nitrosomaritimum yanchengensis]